ncbi:hypothetical protein [Frondihabitans peucedani]|uniref:Uncharacterized protein n=1 Tax=Frondihabitans peucedani TaxID=598626 RepID=A0ABP8DXL7_9MICO
MAVDGGTPGCFEHGARLYAVPSDSAFSVEETRSSYTRSDAARRRGNRPRVHWSAFVGGVLGGAFIDFSAWHTSRLTDGTALAMMFGLGGVVGFATAIGIREALVGRPHEEQVVRLPAIQIPGDIARSAPDDSTPDELVLWSVLTRRYRAARVALDELPFQSNAADASTASRTGTLTPALTQADAELAYVVARHDYEPVAELLGLRLER